PPPIYVYPLSLHDALPIWDIARDHVDARVRLAQLDAVQQNDVPEVDRAHLRRDHDADRGGVARNPRLGEIDRSRNREGGVAVARSEEHTSELQSPDQIVCR